MEAYFDPTPPEKKVEETPSKVAQKYSVFFSSIFMSWAAQRKEFMSQNVAYRPIVYKTGAWWNPESEKIKRSEEEVTGWLMPSYKESGD